MVDSWDLLVQIKEVVNVKGIKEAKVQNKNIEDIGHHCNDYIIISKNYEEL